MFDGRGLATRKKDTTKGRSLDQRPLSEQNKHKTRIGDTTRRFFSTIDALLFCTVRFVIFVRYSAIAIVENEK